LIAKPKGKGRESRVKVLGVEQEQIKDWEADFYDRGDDDDDLFGDLVTKYEKPVEPVKSSASQEDEERSIDDRETMRLEQRRLRVLATGDGYSPTSPAAPDNPYNPTSNTGVDPSQLQTPRSPTGTDNTPVAPIVLPPNMTTFSGTHGGLFGAPTAPAFTYGSTSSTGPAPHGAGSGVTGLPLNTFQYPPAGRNPLRFPPVGQSASRPPPGTRLANSPTSPPFPGSNLSPDNPFANFAHPAPRPSLTYAQSAEETRKRAEKEAAEKAAAAKAKEQNERERELDADGEEWTSDDSRKEYERRTRHNEELKLREELEDVEAAKRSHQDLNSGEERSATTANGSIAPVPVETDEEREAREDAEQLEAIRKIEEDNEDYGNGFAGM
jgi:hypothetical protein